MRQATLIALYGDKPAALRERLAGVQSLVQSHIGVTFAPYDLGQVHGTLLGLNGVEGAPLDNLFLYQQEGTRKQMELASFLEHVRTSGHLPFHLRVGGFRADERPFESRGKSPFERSFSIQGDKVVVLGWPVAGGAFPDALSGLRRDADRFHVRHKYHVSADDADNDFYLRIGLLREPLDAARAAALESAGRDLLARTHLELEVQARDVVLASYDEETLPLASTRTWRLDELPDGMDFESELF